MRLADILCATGLLILAALVAWESWQLNIGWGLNGPEGGFFPFWLAVGLLVCCLVIVIQAVRSPATLRRPLIAPGGVRPVLQVALPALAMVGLTEGIGLYPAAALYLAFYMRWIGRYGWLLIVVVSLAVPLGSYVVFDRWLLVPMPRGYWGADLGL